MKSNGVLLNVCVGVVATLSIGAFAPTARAAGSLTPLGDLRGGTFDSATLRIDDHRLRRPQREQQSVRRDGAGAGSAGGARVNHRCAHRPMAKAQGRE